jgi:hypothetical protein
MASSAPHHVGNCGSRVAIAPDSQQGLPANQPVVVQVQDILSGAEVRHSARQSCCVSVSGSVRVQDADPFVADEDLRTVNLKTCVLKIVAGCDRIALARQQRDHLTHRSAPEMIQVDRYVHMTSR